MTINHDLGPTPAAPLAGTRCPDCERTFYPARDLCPTCWRDGLPATVLPPTGTLATWTVVRMSNTFPTPYAVCYADFDNDVRVFGRVTNWTEGAKLRPGLRITTHVDDAEHTFTIDPADLEA